MRLLALILVLLVSGLVAQGLFDSEAGAWVAIGALFSLVFVKAAGMFGVWPDGWPDLPGGDD